ncbi:unnamed protein product [Schistocephalus solidus]|uniref:Reverse transcriptase domain-containing protein n=1 Tax=Schistocephalus solidus TaxID=70667 RepID=A0A183T860_SCHSO|nr:unnamed protein product [Schistocephalus solidus]
MLLWPPLTGTELSPVAPRIWALPSCHTFVNRHDRWAKPDNPRSNRPQPRTALVARPLVRYKVDIAVLSESRFSEQGQLEDVSAGYTYFWSSRPKAERRNAGVAFAIRNDIMGRLPCLPQGINDRLMNLRLPLWGQNQNQGWFDDNDTDISKLLAEKNRLHKAYMDLRTDATIAAFFRCRRHIQQQLREMQDAWMVRKAKEIERYADSSEIKYFSKVTKAIYGPCMKISKGKAPGSNAIPPEVYKHGGPRLMVELTTLFQDICRQGKLSQDFKDGTIVHLYKRKGNRQLCDNHRGISLLNIAAKIFALHDLLFADDCTLNTVTEEDMQRSMNLLTASYANFGLPINAGKTMIMHQPPPSAENNVRRIKFNGASLKNVETFAYLGSPLSRNRRIDD